VYCAIVLGILDELGITSIGHYTESAEALYYFAHALRRAAYETGFLNDPKLFGDPTPTLMSRDFHRMLASTLRTSRPSIDLTKHVSLTAGPTALVQAGLPSAAPSSSASKQPAGSCELSIVDTEGNWVQMMNTLQSGGIPGEVVDGVPMVGSHAMSGMGSAIAGWFTGGGRMRSVMSNTIVLRDGVPWLSLGSPGNVHCTVPQVLSNILDYGMDPYVAEDTPRMLPFDDSYKISIESRVSPTIVSDLARMGVLVDPLPRYDYHMGSYQMSWRSDDGVLHSTTGPRRSGQAGAL
jgi:gamma-glutamyltranspeptidase/glutathione hydrolase